MYAYTYIWICTIIYTHAVYIYNTKRWGFGLKALPAHPEPDVDVRSNLHMFTYRHIYIYTYVSNCFTYMRTCIHTQIDAFAV